MPIESATVENGKFSFIFNIPKGCINQGSDLVFFGFGFDADSKKMQGYIKWQVKDSPNPNWQILGHEFTLTRSKILKELTIEDKKCQ